MNGQKLSSGNLKMQRGSVWWVSFDPSIGGEIQKRRPAVIVSNDASNKHLNRVQVVPISSNVDHLYPSEAYIELKGQQRKAMADQIATVSKLRFIEKIGAVSSGDLLKIEKAIKTQLGFSGSEGGVR